MSLKLYFNPKDGKLNMEKPFELKEAVKSLREKRHVMEIKEYSPRRSLGANGYYWAVVIPYFCEAMGIDGSIKSEQEYMHYDVLGRELRQIPDEHREGFEKTQQTHEMTGSEFWTYINRCGVFFHDQFGGNFPPPKSLGYDTNKK